MKHTDMVESMLRGGSERQRPWRHRGGDGVEFHEWARDASIESALLIFHMLTVDAVE